MLPSVVGYGGFKSYGDKPYSHLKPGQKSLDRDYYSKATHEQPDGKVALQNFGRFDSVYNQNIAKTVQVGDYKVPNKNANTMISYEFAHNPDLFSHTRVGKIEQMRKTMQEGGGSLSQAGKSAVGFNQGATDKSVSSMSSSQSSSSMQSKTLATSHWKTSYQGVVEQTLSQPAQRSERPQWSLPRQAYTSKRSYFVTEYQKSLGTYGQNPREKLNQDHDKMETELHELTIGTTKTTNHIPGYNGYLPKTDLNPTAILQGLGQEPRATIVKQNIVENYQVRIPGYQGHKPMSVINDRGALRPSCLTTAGETFH